MYFLEKVPAKAFKTMVSYVDGIQGEGKSRIISEARSYLETPSTIPMDVLETQLISESPSGQEQTELKEKIILAK